MGCCLSSNSKIEIRSRPSLSASAKIVSLNGFLREYPVPVNVAQVLEAEASSSSSWFLCNSDRLYYNDYVPALDLQENLEADQIYFVLPISNIHQRLTASDMAALAIKASTAIQDHSHSHRCKKSRNRISPDLTIQESLTDNHHQDHQSTITTFGKPYSQPLSRGLSRSASVRRLQRYTSKRAKIALRSFRLKLSPIDEGTIL